MVGGKKMRNEELGIRNKGVSASLLGLSVLFCLLIGTCSLGTDIETIREMFPEDNTDTDRGIPITIRAIDLGSPVLGAIPETTIRDTAQFTGTVSWVPAHTTFQAMTVYTATITLTPKSPWTLQGVPADFFTVAGETTVRNNANSGVVTVFFRPTTDPAVFNSVADLGTWLFAQPDNYPNEAYTVALNVNDLSGSASIPGSIGNILQANRTKYVNIDLSGSTITSIEEDAFYNCNSLTSVIIIGSITSIGEHVFSGCSSLTSVSLPIYSVTSIGDGAFKGCSSFIGVAIPDGVTSIGCVAFADCTSLTSVIIPDSVISIEDGAFSGCSSLTSVTFQEIISSNNLAYNAFEGDLYEKYLTGGMGAYTTTAPVSDSSVWTKQ